MQFYVKNTLENTVFKKTVLAIIYRLETDHSLSYCVVFTFVGSILKKQTMKNLKFNSVYMFLPILLLIFTLQLDDFK